MAMASSGAAGVVSSATASGPTDNDNTPRQQQEQQRSIRSDCDEDQLLPPLPTRKTTATAVGTTAPPTPATTAIAATPAATTPPKTAPSPSTTTTTTSTVATSIPSPTTTATSAATVAAATSSTGAAAATITSTVSSSGGGCGGHGLGATPATPAVLAINSSMSTLKKVKKAICKMQGTPSASKTPGTKRPHPRPPASASKQMRSPESVLQPRATPKSTRTPRVPRQITGGTPVSAARSALVSRFGLTGGAERAPVSVSTVSTPSRSRGGGDGVVNGGMRPPHQTPRQAAMSARKQFTEQKKREAALLKQQDSEIKKAAKAKQDADMAEQQRILKERGNKAQQQRLAAAVSKKLAKAKEAEEQALELKQRMEERNDSEQLLKRQDAEKRRRSLAHRSEMWSREREHKVKKNNARKQERQLLLQGNDVFREAKTKLKQQQTTTDKQERLWRARRAYLHKTLERGEVDILIYEAYHSRRDRAIDQEALDKAAKEEACQRRSSLQWRKNKRFLDSEIERGMGGALDPFRLIDDLYQREEARKEERSFKDAEKVSRRESRVRRRRSEVRKKNTEEAMRIVEMEREADIKASQQDGRDDVKAYQEERLRLARQSLEGRRSKSRQAKIMDQDEKELTRHVKFEERQITGLTRRDVQAYRREMEEAKRMDEEYDRQGQMFDRFRRQQKELDRKAEEQEERRIILEDRESVSASKKSDEQAELDRREALREPPSETTKLEILEAIWARQRHPAAAAAAQGRCSLELQTLREVDSSELNTSNESGLAGRLGSAAEGGVEEVESPALSTNSELLGSPTVEGAGGAAFCGGVPVDAASYAGGILSPISGMSPSSNSSNSTSSGMGIKGRVSDDTDDSLLARWRKETSSREVGSSPGSGSGSAATATSLPLSLSGIGSMVEGQHLRGSNQEEEKEGDRWRDVSAIGDGQQDFLVLPQAMRMPRTSTVTEEAAAVLAAADQSFDTDTDTSSIGSSARTSPGEGKRQKEETTLMPPSPCSAIIDSSFRSLEGEDFPVRVLVFPPIVELSVTGGGGAGDDALLKGSATENMSGGDGGVGIENSGVRTDGSGDDGDESGRSLVTGGIAFDRPEGVDFDGDHDSGSGHDHDESGVLMRSRSDVEGVAPAGLRSGYNSYKKVENGGLGGATVSRGVVSFDEGDGNDDVNTSTSTAGGGRGSSVLGIATANAMNMHMNINSGPLPAGRLVLGGGALVSLDGSEPCPAHISIGEREEKDDGTATEAGSDGHVTTPMVKVGGGRVLAAATPVTPDDL